MKEYETKTVTRNINHVDVELIQSKHGKLWRFTAGSKSKIARFNIDDGISKLQLAREVGVVDMTIGDWVNRELEDGWNINYAIAMANPKNIRRTTLSALQDELEGNVAKANDRLMSFKLLVENAESFGLKVS